jgi:cytochrome c oxidase cbb3-type subunit 1
MSPDRRVVADGRLFDVVAVHSLWWLTVANGVGLLLSTLLLFPAAGVALAPWTYGRWASLHLDLALYGWCALPLVGLLFRFYLPPAGFRPVSELAVHVWSGSLLAGAVAWLMGQTSGKLYLDWTGLSRLLFIANLLFLSGVLLIAACGQAWARLGRAGGLRPSEIAALIGKAVLWLALVTVPFVLFAASSPDSYPAINAASGGPTGVSLLGSTLAVLWIFAATPGLLGLTTRDRSVTVQTFGLLALHTGLFVALLDHGDHTHGEPAQIAAVASLLLWSWLLPRHLLRFTWPSGSRPWMLAFLGWGGLLVVSAVLIFLPGVLDRVKFTNTLVAHAHVAMAGLATSFAVLVLIVLTEATGLGRIFMEPRTFGLWQGGCVAHVSVLVIAGTLEAVDPGVLFRLDSGISTLYAVRWLAGAAMLAGSLRWLGGAIRGVVV